MKTIITGGAGFVGSNLAAILSSDGHEVTIVDNLSRKGTEKNLAWLETNHPSISFIRGDVRDFSLLCEVVKGADLVCHLAAQVAVTTSVCEPLADFAINAHGTLNLLEAVRQSNNQPLVIFTSTNKVYGGMEDICVREGDQRYEFVDRGEGISENRILDFHSPYGCSKGAADQYVRDYWRIYGIPTVVFRMSCIYGPRQFGNEDQGWVAHFIISHVLGRPLNIYGNGKQVRDILFVEDLARAFIAAYKNREKIAGSIYNIGGGPDNTFSLLELLDLLNTISPSSTTVSFADWRPGDQPMYVSDIRKAKAELGWSPQVSKVDGIHRLVDWVNQNRTAF